MSYTFCDGISKLIPNKPGATLAHDERGRAIKAEPMLAERWRRKKTSRRCWSWRKSSKA
jgi:DNA polymerase-3 subunit alpha